MYPIFSSFHIYNGNEYQNHSRRSIVHNSHTFFIRTILYEQKALILAKKIKNKIRTKPDLLSHRTLEQTV